MKCSEVIDQIPFYCYGEVSPEVEELVESHVSTCPSCKAELGKHRAFLEILSERPSSLEETASGTLLSSCRSDLLEAIHTEGVPAGRSWVEMLRGLAELHIPFRVPVGAMALVALGFFGARITPEQFGGVRASLAEPTFSSVRSVEDKAGKVNIAVDEIHRRVVSGSLQDPRIQELLLNAVREESNAGVRVDSIGMLKNSTDSEEVRNALLDALTHDPNPGVRLKALEGLKSYAGNAAVRRTLANVLLKDENPGVRVQTIDLLTTHHDDSIVGVLQDVVEREDNSYVRARCRKLLEDMKASVGTY